MIKQAQAVTRRFMRRGFYSVSLVGMVLFAQALPSMAQTRMVNSDGEVIIVERPKPTIALRSRWITPGVSGVSARLADELEDTAEASAELQPLGALLDVLGRNGVPAEVDIPMALIDPSEQARTVNLSSRIEVLGRDDGDELPQILAALLRDSGEQLVRFKIVQTQVSVDQIRYFHESDRTHAEYIASLLDDVFDSLPVRDYSFYRPSPPQGLLEIWIQ